MRLIQLIIKFWKYWKSNRRTGTLIESLGVVTKSGSLVEKFGINEGLPSYIWPLEAAEIKNKYDVGMVVSFGKLITNDVIQSFPLWVMVLL